MKKAIEGIFTSILTPFKKDSLKVDFDALINLTGFLADHGCNGVIPLSTYGEFTSLNIIEKKQILVSIMEARENMIVMPNIGSDNLEETLELAHFAQGIGVDGLIIIPPYFYNDLETEGLVNYYKKILNVISIPVYLYNIPKYTGVSIEDSLLDELMETGKITGIKDASGDIGLIQHFKTKYPQLKILLAHETLFYEGLVLGVNGIVSYLGNAFPEAIESIVFDFHQPKRGGRSAQLYVNEIHHIIRKYPRISALKYIATLRGLPESDVRLPLTGLTDKRKDELKTSLMSYITNPTLIS